MVESASKKESGTTELVPVDTNRDTKDTGEMSCSEGEDSDLLVDVDIKEEKLKKEKAEADAKDDDDS
jgi:hypothetical protein